MLKNFWYGLAFSSELKGHGPIRITALGQEFVVFRISNGKIVLQSDLCVHRGGALSDGWIKDDCVVCPYHGWEYDASGACAKIPANKTGIPIPKTARVDSYPVVEKHGMIFGFLGDLPEDERPPLPDLPYIDDPDYRRIEGSFTWNAHVDRVLENGIDISHTPFVHGGSFGNKDKPEITAYDVKLGEWCAIFSSELDPPAPKGLWKKLYPEDRETTKVEAGFWMPNVSILSVRLPLGHMVIYNLHVPVDDHTTISKFATLRTFMKDGPQGWLKVADADTKRRTLKIFSEDQHVVEAQRPELLPLNLADELHVKSDRIMVEYRRFRQQAIDKGWAIDTHKVRDGYTNQMATVIPSPARREVPELANAWIMREVPTMQGANGNGNAADDDGVFRGGPDTPEAALARRAAAEEKMERAKAKSAAARAAKAESDA